MIDGAEVVPNWPGKSLSEDRRFWLRLLRRMVSYLQVNLDEAFCYAAKSGIVMLVYAALRVL